MTFWTYMLHCHGGHFYVGHTDNLEHRIVQHQSGMVAGFTADHQPVEFVWSQEFPTRDEAKASERRIKGWSRAKKLALIRGDWDRISVLAKKKGSPSTSSGQTGEGEGYGSKSSLSPKSDHPELVEGLSFSLQPHPEARPSRDCTVCAKVRIADGLAWLTFEVDPADTIRIPSSVARQRLDGLWRTTCFELFVQQPKGYAEFNFSPSGDWAAYRFSGYRDGMRNLAMRTAPTIQALVSGDRLTVSISLDRTAMSQDCTFALSAVIEELDGTKSYWALAHPPGDPDFHHPTCFAATLPPPSNT
jgi:predicted GIY-YIG superfamily endonuclease